MLIDPSVAAGVRRSTRRCFRSQLETSIQVLLQGRVTSLLRTEANRDASIHSSEPHPTTRVPVPLAPHCLVRSWLEGTQQRQPTGTVRTSYGVAKFPTRLERNKYVDGSRSSQAADQTLTFLLDNLQDPQLFRPRARPRTRRLLPQLGYPLSLIQPLFVETLASRNPAILLSCKINPRLSTFTRPPPLLLRARASKLPHRNNGSRLLNHPVSAHPPTQPARVAPELAHTIDRCSALLCSALLHPIPSPPLPPRQQFR